jgi:hypothetical protein
VTFLVVIALMLAALAWCGVCLALIRREFHKARADLERRP